jgi:beta-alanine--pyruvate transaminase
MGAVELESRAGAPGARAYEVFLKCMEMGVLVRFTGDSLAFSPPLIVSEDQIDEIFNTVKKAIHLVA